MLGYFKAIHCKKRGTQKVTCKKDKSDFNDNTGWLVQQAMLH